MKLYEIDQAIETLLNNGFVADEETGELLFTSVDIEKLQMEKDKKVENIALYIKDLQAEAAAIKTEEEALKKRRLSAEKKTEYLTDFLSFLLKGEKFKTPKVAITYRKSQSVSVADIGLLPEEYINIKTDKTANKTFIKAALKDGITIPGCELVENTSIQIK